MSSVSVPGLAFIFDLDGVLVHSMPLHTEAWRRYLKKMDLEFEDLETRMHGKRNAELVQDLLGGDLSDDVVFEHGAAKERLWREMMLAGGLDQYRVHGVAEFLERYRGVPKAIGSNAEPANISFVLDHFGLREYFDVIVDGQQVDNPKPAPDIYLKAAELLGTEPANCIVFEDSPTGIEAGRAAGMRLVGVETTPTQFESVDLHVQDFADPRLESWLQAQRVF
ncbi:MAG: HAD family phosphatase [Acidobacteriota bacterium]|nr:HAD family phosphatase [Acidobacteriota bacterium]